MHSREEQYAALTRGAGWVDVSDRSQIEVRGDDRAAFLHNMCTQEVKKLGPGTGAEAFLTDAKGHVLAFVDLFVTPDSIVIDTVAEQSAAIIAHLDKYIIREDVQLVCRDKEWAQLLVAGETTAQILKTLATDSLPENLWEHAANTIANQNVFVRRVALAGSTSFAIVMQNNAVEQLTSALDAAGIVACDADILETLRIENRTAYYGRDITDRNLPQEVDRNETAIHFNKGCYIGQETVARLDALGHVNKRLVALKFAGADVPQPGTELLKEDQPVGAVTSSTFSPKYDAPVALGYARYAHSTPGTQLSSSAGEAEIV